MLGVSHDRSPRASVFIRILTGVRGPPPRHHRSSHLRFRSKRKSGTTPTRHQSSLTRRRPRLDRMMLKVTIGTPTRCASSGVLRKHWRRSTAPSPYKHYRTKAHDGQGITLASLQRFDEAISSFDTAVALKPDYAEAYNNRHLVLHDLNRLDAALSSFNRAIALRPGDPRVHKNYGALLEDLKRFEDAVDSYDSAIALQPDDADAYNNRGLALLELRSIRSRAGKFRHCNCAGPGLCRSV